MSWGMILKSKLGNIPNRFLRDNLPTREEIDALDDDVKNIELRRIDTVLTDLREQYESSLKGKDIPNKVVTQMITGRRSKVADTRKEALEIIGKRIKQLEALSGGVVNPTMDKTIAGITFSELVSPQGKTNKEWTIETLNALYQMMVSEPSVELLYALNYFIENNNREGSRGKGGTWQGEMGKKSIENPDPQALKNIFNLRSDPDVTGNIDRKVFNFFNAGNKYAYNTEGMKTIKIRSGKDSFEGRTKREFDPKTGKGKVELDADGNPVKIKTKTTEGFKSPDEASTNFKRRGGFKETTKEVGEQVVMGEKSSLELKVSNTLARDLTNISMYNFTSLINTMNKYNGTQELFIRALKGKGTEIAYDLIFNPKPLNNIIKDVETRRQGDDTKQRIADFLRDWSIGYVNSEGRDAQEDGQKEFSVGNQTLLTDKYIRELKEENTRDGKTLIAKHYSDKRKLLNWIKDKIKSEDETWLGRYQRGIRTMKTKQREYDRLPQEEKDAMTPDEKREFFRREVSEGVGLSDVTYSVKSNTNFVDFIEELGVSGRFNKSVLSILYDFYIKGGEEGVEDGGADLITVSSAFSNYMPTGRLFSDGDSTTFIESMQAILTYIKLLLGRERLSEYNDIMDTEIISALIDNINPLFTEAAEDEGMDIEEDKEDIWEVIVDDDLLSEEMKSSYLGTKAGLDKIYNIIEDCVLDLESALVGLLVGVITDIASDTTATYKKSLRTYLITKKYLMTPTAPRRIKRNGKNYELDSSTATENLNDTITYYPYEKNKAKGAEGILLDKENPLEITLREILGDE